MKRKREVQIAPLVVSVLRQQGLETPLNEYRLLEQWKKISPVITNNTRETYIRDQRLYVRVVGSVLKNELYMQRALLVQKLNAAVGAQVIVDIVFL